MEYDVFVETAHKAGDLAAAGDCEGAIAIFKELTQSDLPDKDKAVMCANVAALYHRIGRQPEAFMWYDKGVDFEERVKGFFVMEQRAAYYALVNRPKESLQQYEVLLNHPGLNAADKVRIQAQVRETQKKAA